MLATLTGCDKGAPTARAPATEAPNPLPADTKLWVELENAEDTRLKDSTPIQ